MKKKAGLKAMESVKPGMFITDLNWQDAMVLSGIFFTFMSIMDSHYMKLELGLAFMFLAMLADTLSSLSADRHGVKTEKGRHLDSFIGMLNYLIAPTVFYFYLGFERLSLTWVLLIFNACGAVRLSTAITAGHANEESHPGAPLAWSHFIAAFFYGLALFIKNDAVVYAAAAVVGIYSILMVMTWVFKRHDHRLVKAVSSAMIACLFFWLAVHK